MLVTHIQHKLTCVVSLDTRTHLNRVCCVLLQLGYANNQTPQEHIPPHAANWLDQAGPEKVAATSGLSSHSSTSVEQETKMQTMRNGIMFDPQPGSFGSDAEDPPTSKNKIPSHLKVRCLLAINSNKKLSVLKSSVL